MKEEKVGGKRKRVRFDYGCVMSMLVTYQRNWSPLSHNKIPKSNRKDN